MRLIPAIILSSVCAFLVASCSPTGSQPTKTTGGHRHAKARSGDDGAPKHDSWWCDEHGIPEAECSMCSAKVANAFKAKGDWCEKHNRARSQCFKCDPSLQEVFAAKYRARYPGKEPPPIQDD
jgi:hypothetical protein